MNELLEKYKEVRFAKDEMVSYSTEEIQQLIKKGSDKKLGRIKRNIKIELMLTLVILVVMVGMIVLNVKENGEVIMSACIATLVSACYYLLFLRIKSISFAQADVKTSLKLVIGQLEKTLKLYYRIAILSFPVIYFGIYVFLKFWNGDAFVPMFSEDWRVLAFGTMVSIAMPLFTKWVLRHLYQKHIDELKTNLDILKM